MLLGTRRRLRFDHMGRITDSACPRGPVKRLGAKAQWLRRQLGTGAGAFRLQLGCLLRVIS